MDVKPSSSEADHLELARSGLTASSCASSEVRSFLPSYVGSQIVRTTEPCISLFRSTNLRGKGSWRRHYDLLRSMTSPEPRPKIPKDDRICNALQDLSCHGITLLDFLRQVLSSDRSRLAEYRRRFFAGNVEGVFASMGSTVAGRAALNRTSIDKGSLGVMMAATGVQTDSQSTTVEDQRGTHVVES